MIEIKGNVKLITSGNVPTIDDLAVGEIAFGKVSFDGKVHMYCNPGDENNTEGRIVELAIEVDNL